eukprot:TRINITY_DN108844_c0_g1_i1.p1 TRINITY_DN108844_c0_g1~~TRINITY_DN108844_c0_g1_i1.p1  ORF type:complete len:542 (+),score=80.64 TRINITY_DN108844_c0_g1_i1:70-1695(+)
MSKIKCSETGKDAEFWCVDLKKAFSAKCLGRIINFDNPKTINYTIEKIDYEHIGTHEITTYILNAAVTAIIVLMFLSRGWTENYFKGEPVCPSIGVGRSILARFDMNAFYYLKSSISTYCDIEDSFWRLGMDGWYRGVVTSSDSWLLLLVTMPKAMIFKSTIVMLLQPVLGVIYGLVGVLIDRLVFFGITEANVIQSWWERVSGAKIKAKKPPSRTLSVQEASDLGLPKQSKPLPVTTYQWVQAKRSLYLKFLSKICDVLFLAGLVRLVWAYFLGKQIRSLAWLVSSPRDLAFEVGVYYALSFLCKKIDASLNKIFGKPSVPGSTGEPLTLPSDAYGRNMGRSYSAQWTYFRSRMNRLYASYKRDAGAIGATVETAFFSVVGLRLVGILVMPYFNIAKVLRSLLTMIGFGRMLSDHSEWFALETGYQDNSGLYLSESLADFGLMQLFSTASTSLEVGKQVAFGETDSISGIIYHAYEVFWRALVPFAFFQLQKRYKAFNEAREAAFKAKWKSADGGDGTFIGWMETHGCPMWAPVQEKRCE